MTGSFSLQEGMKRTTGREQGESLLTSEERGQSDVGRGSEKQTRLYMGRKKERERERNE